MAPAPLTAVPDADDGDELADVKEGLDLRDNGTIRLYIDGDRYRLRRPRAREFRRLREAYQEASDAISDESDVVEAWSRELRANIDKRRAEDPTATQTPEERREDRKRGRQLTEFVETTMFGWWAEVIEVLESDGRTPILANEPGPSGEALEDHDPFANLPMWMGTVPSANTVLAHWRAVPSLSGAR